MIIYNDFYLFLYDMVLRLLGVNVMACLYVWMFEVAPLRYILSHLQKEALLRQRKLSLVFKTLCRFNPFTPRIPYFALQC